MYKKLLFKHKVLEDFIWCGSFQRLRVIDMAKLYSDMMLLQIHLYRLFFWNHCVLVTGKYINRFISNLLFLHLYDSFEKVHVE